jgi:L-asparagine permease
VITTWATLAFLGFSDGAKKIAFYSIPVLAIGWRVIKRREHAPAE